MAQKRISELTAATTPLNGTDEFHINQGGTSKRADFSDVTAALGAKLTKSGNQSQTGTTFEALTFDQTDFDAGGFADLANDRITIPAGQDGVYLLRASVIGPSASTDGSIQIKVNGAVVTLYNGAKTSGNDLLRTATVESLVAGDDETVEVRDNNGTGTWDADTDTYLAVVKMGGV